VRKFAPRIIRLAICCASFCPIAARAGESWLVEVRETAGIERFGYPLCGEFKAPVGGGAALELRDGAQRIPAQFTRLGQAPDDVSPWSVDFALDLAPSETRRLRIVRADKLADQQGRRRLTVEQRDAKTIVRHPSLEFVIPNDLKGLFDRIDVSEDDFVVADAAGLVVCLQDGSEVPFVLSTLEGAPPSPRIVKSGPLAVFLEYEGQFALPGGKSLRSHVALDFPLGKSWVCVDWTVDQISTLAGIGADVRLRLEPQKSHPVLADVGANGWTYAVLKPNESLAYLAEPASVVAKHVWSVDRIIGNVAKPYALPSESGGPAPQGWAHLLDAERCTAIAVDQFAAHTRDSMRLSADGLVQLRREFMAEAEKDAAPRGQRRLKFWLHVVRSPAQIGAATNPQSMQTPPEVTIFPCQSAAAAGE
jgi:hypothetical protein